MTTIKISKFLSEAGIASRRKAESLVMQGLVFVNGSVLTNPARRIDPEADRIIYNGKNVKPQLNVYYLLNKPLGYTSTTYDPHSENLVTELVPPKPKVWPVGRLDKFTSGLMIITNDGNLTQRLTHPSFLVKKEYEIVTNIPLTNSDINAISRGLYLDDGFIRPDCFKKTGEKSYCIVIHSGKKRIVRRIIEKTGKSVSQLKRLRIGPISINGLHSGKWRYLNNKEIRQLLSKPRG